VHGGDDLFGVDPLQVDRRRAEIHMTQLALDDVQRHAFARELERMGVAQLVRREPAPNARLKREPAQLVANAGARPGPPASWAVDDAEQRSDRQLDAGGEPGSQLVPAPGIHADLAPPPALAVGDKHRAAPGVEVALGQRQRFLDAQPAAPERDDQRPQPGAVAIVGVWRITAMISSTVGGSAG
jgi:hypothetical protein